MSYTPGLEPDSPPSRASLVQWWKQFKTKPAKKPEGPKGIFNVPLQESIKYAHVAISLTDPNGESFVYGYIPIVIAKCGVFLKSQGLDTEGVFRISGSAKRIKELQLIFDSPPKYGKNMDWRGYTVHDAANVLRRYLNQLPEPIVPHDFYEQFRSPIVEEPYNETHAIEAYQYLICLLPSLNRQLLLYILDLLAVFASKANENLMTAENLAAIFQPGIISHPNHDMSPDEYRICQKVLIFLIEHQDHFLLGMGPTGMHQQPPTPPGETRGARRQTALGMGMPPQKAADLRRSRTITPTNSVANAAAVRRNASITSSRVGSPSGHGSSVANVSRSNTLPSKRRMVPGTAAGGAVMTPTREGKTGSPSIHGSPSPLGPGTPVDKSPRPSGQVEREDVDEPGVGVEAVQVQVQVQTPPQQQQGFARPLVNPLHHEAAATALERGMQTGEVVSECVPPSTPAVVPVAMAPALKITRPGLMARSSSYQEDLHPSPPRDDITHAGLDTHQHPREELADVKVPYTTLEVESSPAPSAPVSSPSSPSKLHNLGQRLSFGLRHKKSEDSHTPTSSVTSLGSSQVPWTASPVRGASPLHYPPSLTPGHVQTQPSLQPQPLQLTTSGQLAYQHQPQRHTRLHSNSLSSTEFSASAASSRRSSVVSVTGQGMESSSGRLRAQTSLPGLQQQGQGRPGIGQRVPSASNLRPEDAIGMSIPHSGSEGREVRNKDSQGSLGMMSTSPAGKLGQWFRKKRSERGSISSVSQSGVGEGGEEGGR
ncbi:RhoGAP-domain-containing protein [Saitoella complicata NRRL Y-17804]|uniref:RhoGAP-domain-containing protein n=1 Tax=Saitoella complicata (strain BCRC 22490 / CBS 7301 / JCM 7358 / NBRC 10748 / NRRL Y-17804) TaxID=698492 RepID=UPI000867A80B|nr:RhoGAP-domain-containing protein [Saitoella complicata NRRL Y-17804]ODQ52645.1 RhoGAP-domain-containing protein [Saitoella complicata NRRL Y-17804]